MPKCPRCGEELNVLDSVEHDIVTYEFNGKEYKEVEKEAELGMDPVYCCPACGERLAFSEEEARRVLGKV